MSLSILADEAVERVVVTALRSNGYDVAVADEPVHLVLTVENRTEVIVLVFEATEDILAPVGRSPVDDDDFEPLGVHLVGHTPE